MVKSVLGVNHQGLTDWIIQRTSAIVMAAWSLWLIFYILLHPELSFAEWHSLFAHTGVKIATILFITALLYHAWIGMWTVFTDYIKCAVIRAIADFLTLLMLFACFAWGVLILWNVQ